MTGGPCLCYGTWRKKGYTTWGVGWHSLLTDLLINWCSQCSWENSHLSWARKTWLVPLAVTIGKQSGVEWHLQADTTTKNIYALTSNAWATKNENPSQAKLAKNKQKAVQMRINFPHCFNFLFNIFFSSIFLAAVSCQDIGNACRISHTIDLCRRGNNCSWPSQRCPDQPNGIKQSDGRTLDEEVERLKGRIIGLILWSI